MTGQPGMRLSPQVTDASAIRGAAPASSAGTDVKTQVEKFFADIENLPFGTRFFYADLHFHTPSSSDARGPNKYGFNPYGMFYLVDQADPKREQYRVLKDLKVIQEVGVKILDVLELDYLNELAARLSMGARILEDVQELMSIRNKYDKDLKKAKNTSLEKSYGNVGRAAISTLIADMKNFERLPALDLRGLKVLESWTEPCSTIFLTNEELNTFKVDPGKKKKKTTGSEPKTPPGDPAVEIQRRIETIFQAIKRLPNIQSIPAGDMPGIQKDLLVAFAGRAFQNIPIRDENKIRAQLQDQSGLSISSTQAGEMGKTHKAVQLLTDVKSSFMRYYIRDLQDLQSKGPDAIASLPDSEVVRLINTFTYDQEVMKQTLSDVESTLSDINVFIDYRVLKNPRDFKLSETLLSRLPKRPDKQYDFVTDFDLSVALEKPGYPQTLREYQYQILLYARVKAAQIVCGFLEKGLSLVAITDHNGMGTIWGDEVSTGKMDLAAPTWYELIDDAAQKANKAWGTRLAILPGVEVSTTGVHILAIFKPQDPRRKVHLMVCDLVEEVGIAPDDWCNNSAVGNMSPYDTIELITKKGGIAIPAHVDGDDKALLELYKLEIGALENVVGNKNLRAVEVINPDRFREGETKIRLDKVRSERDLSSLAYFQGSDSHDIEDIAKRATVLKMTKPSFESLKAATKMPSSRVRFSSDRKDWDGLYLRGMVFDHPILGRKTLRFNRNLNCISGKVGVGKSTLHNLMQAASNPNCPYPQGKEGGPPTPGFVALFVEKILVNNGAGTDKVLFDQYVFYRNAEASQDPSEPVVKFYSISQNGNTATESKLEEAHQKWLQPRFYNADRIQQIIDIEQELEGFLCGNFDIQPADFKDKEAASIKNFNKLFLLTRFFGEEAKGQLLELSWDKAAGKHTLKMNMQWRVDDASMRKFSGLSKSQRKTALMCMIIRKEEFGPVIIDEPEQEFDNEDMTKFLVPLIQEFKDKRQILLFTNHPILAVNTDPDNYFLLHLEDAEEERAKPELVINSGFAIDAQDGDRELLIKVLEGDLGAFRKRSVRYEQ